MDETNTSDVTHISVEAAEQALCAAGFTARIWRGGKVVRLYIGRDNYVAVDRDGDVDIQAVRMCSTISGSARKWEIYEVLKQAAQS